MSILWETIKPVLDRQELLKYMSPGDLAHMESDINNLPLYVEDELGEAVEDAVESIEESFEDRLEEIKKKVQELREVL